MPKEKTKAGEGFFSKQIKLKRVYPENLQSHFAQNLVVQHEPGIFILSFFETWPPIVLGEGDEEQRRLLENINEVESKCIARIVLTPERMAAFTKAMEQNLFVYENRFQTEISDKGE